ncbi:MAG: dUTP diphosphatase [Clostridium sp.]|uniref:dUTP diphosphatase n=1 Tax=Clostridium sp. TaxID=1506 RepID=UPI003F31A9F5
MKDLRIKYFEGATKLERIAKGNWIDIYANKDVFIPLNGYAMIPLGFALELPKGYEGYLLPRSSTFKTWGITQSNNMGIVDDSYIGDNDQWHMPVICSMSTTTQKVMIEDNKITCMGTWIRKGDKIGQMRIQESMPSFDFIEVESFGNQDRGGFGSTGTK